MKETNDHKDNTGMIIAIVIAILLVVGLIAYFVMNNNDVKNAADDVTDTIENVTDNDKKTASDVAGSYQASINNDNGEDVASDNEDFVELVLDKDGSARLVITSESNDEITGTFTVTNNRIIVTGDNAGTTNKTTATTDEDNNTNTADNNTNTTNQTYHFTINMDDTLTYTDGNNNVTLAKVDNDSLRYIK